MPSPGPTRYRPTDFDRIEFFAPDEPAASPYRRFGDEKRYQPYFEALTQGFAEAWADSGFQSKLDVELTYLARRPSSLQHARRLSQTLGGAQIYIKREDASPRDTHLIIAVVGQALLAQRMGLKTLVTSTTDGRRGVVTASIAARLGMEAVVFMDSKVSSHHNANVFRMWLLGAEVQAPPGGRGGRSSDPRYAALEYCAQHLDRSLLVLGLDGACEPYPQMQREFASSIGRECQRQLRFVAKRSPDLLVARGGNNPDALGLFPAFIAQSQTRLVCVEPAESVGREGLFPSDPTKVPMTASEQKVAATIMEGGEYPSVVREHGWLKASGRVEYVKVSADVAKKAIHDLSHQEGFVPAIQTAHALGWACQAAAMMRPEQVVAVVMSESEEKDIWDIGRLMGAPF